MKTAGPAAIALLALAFCFASLARAETGRHETALVAVETRTVAEFSHPWGMTMLPDGSILVTERDGRLWRVAEDGAKSEISGLPQIAAFGQGGLLDIAADPDFANNNTIWFSFSEPGPGGAGTALASARLEGSRLADVKTVFSMNRKTGRGQHFGSRIVFARDGTIFLTVGDRGDMNRAQDAFDHAGSVIRIHRDGSIPADNPFADGTLGAPEIWSTGHRNPQGATLHPETGELFTVEHGAQGGDEINAPKAGRNHGWPVITYGRNYNGAAIGEGTEKEGMEQPLWYWDPSIAPSGMAFGTGNAFPQWNGDLFVGALKDMKLVRMELEDGKPEPAETLFEGEFGRIRDVRFFPDGNLYLLIDDDPGALVRVSPAR